MYASEGLPTSFTLIVCSPIAKLIQTYYLGSSATDNQIPGRKYHGVQNLESIKLLSTHDEEDNRKRGSIDNNTPIVRSYFSFRESLKTDPQSLSCFVHRFSVTDLSTQVFIETIESQGRSLLRFLHVRRPFLWWFLAIRSTSSTLNSNPEFLL